MPGSASKASKGKDEVDGESHRRWREGCYTRESVESRSLQKSLPSPDFELDRVSAIIQPRIRSCPGDSQPSPRIPCTS